MTDILFWETTEINETTVNTPNEQHIIPCFDLIPTFLDINLLKYFDTTLLKNISLVSKNHHEKCVPKLAYIEQIKYEIDVTNKETIDRFRRMINKYKSGHVMFDISAGGIIEKKAKKEEPSVFVLHLPDHIASVMIEYHKLEMFQRGFKCIEIYHTGPSLCLQLQKRSDSAITGTESFIVVKKAGELSLYHCSHTRDVLLPTSDFIETATHISISGILTASKESLFYKYCEDLYVGSLITERPLIEWEKLTNILLSNRTHDFSADYIIPSSVTFLDVHRSSHVRSLVPANGYFLDHIKVKKLEYTDVSYILKLAKRIDFKHLCYVPTDIPLQPNDIVTCPPTLVILDYTRPKKDNLDPYPFLDFSKTDMDFLHIYQDLVLKLPLKCRSLSLFRYAHEFYETLILPDNLIKLHTNDSFEYTDNPAIPIGTKEIIYEKMYTFPLLPCYEGDIKLTVDTIMDDCNFKHIGGFPPSLTTFKCCVHNSLRGNLLAFGRMFHIKHLDITIATQKTDTFPYELICPNSLRTLKITFKTVSIIDIIIKKNKTMRKEDFTLVDKGLNGVIYCDKR